MLGAAANAAASVSDFRPGAAESIAAASSMEERLSSGVRALAVSVATAAESPTVAAGARAFAAAAERTDGAACNSAPGALSAEAAAETETVSVGAATSTAPASLAAPAEAPSHTSVLTIAPSRSALAGPSEDGCLSSKPVGEALAIAAAPEPCVLAPGATGAAASAAEADSEGIPCASRASSPKADMNLARAGDMGCPCTDPKAARNACRAGDTGEPCTDAGVPAPSCNVRRDTHSKLLTL